jgi:DNA-directed RNA polymerase specialized sigma24 family protein
MSNKFLIVEYKPELDMSCIDIDTVALLEDARAYMATMPERTARICHMYYTVGQTFEDIAEIENMSMSAVRKTTSRVSKKLRKRYA